MEISAILIAEDDIGRIFILHGQNADWVL